ncbi:microsomal triglyceride transfer protein large subunit isoform X1 [Lucilia sericata]|uniref:microsomal triglyceride transfer protein large subunit isoform X1 n=2 Tax=Lucilia sericata TaxID=13632 RepID=UPI0018A86542|nr:microsomal triglyceride transfer protein large subunit isoform X1 [Lucilia sericata]
MIIRFLRIVVCLIFCFSCCCLAAAFSPLIPYESQQYYVLENKVSTKQLQHVSSQEISYTFNSLLKINSVWNSDNEQLIQVYFTENRVSAPGKKGNVKVQEIEKIPDRPFYISFIDNKPSKVIAHTSRDQSLLNMERGIASLMHINFENGPVSEIDVSGMCNNFYNIKSSTKVNKIKTDCSHWDLKVNYRGEKPLGVHQKSFERVEYDLSADGQLLLASSVETHKLSLEAQPEVGTQVESLLFLKHTAFAAEPVEQLPYKTSEEAIKSLLEWYRVFEIEADVDGVISEIKDITLKQQVDSFNNDLTDDLIGKEALAEAFVKLIPLARITKQEEFVDILKSNKKLHSQLVDLLGAVQTIDAHKAIHEIFDYNKKSDVDLLEKYLQSLSVGTHPERSIIEDLFERLTTAEENAIKNEKLQDSVLQCVASLTHQSGFDSNDKLLKEIKDFIFKNLLEVCEEEVCKTRYIRALQNLRDPTTISILMKYALKEETKISVAAMQALKSFPIIHFNEKHRQAFTHIFYQIPKKYDSSARTLALDILLAMKPTPEQLGHLLDYLASNDRHFEIKTYVIQKLKMLSDKCPRFRALLEAGLYERPHINNYHIIGQKGLTTVLSRELSWAPAFNESLLSTQEIYQGVLKRGSVELILSAGREETSTFKLGIYTSGLTSFVGDSEEDTNDDDEEVDDSPATAGMEIAVQGVLLRPLIFFTGQSELMGHVWSGTASDPTPAFQATTLAQDHEHYIILSSGATVYTRVIGSKSVDLNGKVDFSIWNRNANTEIQQNSAAAVHGIMKAGFTYAQVSNEFLLTYEPKISLQADIDFYSGIKLCMQLQRPKMQLKHFNTKLVTLQADHRFSKKVLSKYSYNFPGRTLALNQKNNEMCNMIFN